MKNKIASFNTREDTKGFLQAVNKVILDYGHSEYAKLTEAEQDAHKESLGITPEKFNGKYVEHEQTN